jgi:ABC-type transport system involved in multi-copper enzyme maturation permease subunit
MADRVDRTLCLVLDPAWLMGPVLGKELRVASRRWKHYLLRCAYVGLLAVVVLHFWSFSVRGSGGAGPAVARVAYLGQIGKGVIVTTIWFQFIAAQILAVVLLSDAIGGEIRRRTLEDLLVTPIRTIHVVWGKFLGGLLHILLLLAISLPVLTLVRVFGGVPWDYVVAGLCITASASMFAGALSLLCSTLYRRPCRVVLVVGLWYLALWGLDGLQLFLLPWATPIGNRAGALLWSLVSPLHALYVRTQTMLAGPSPASPCVSLAPHCLTILLAAAILLVLSARRVRRLNPALTHGPANERLEAATIPSSDGGQVARRTRAGQMVRRVEGTPLTWLALGLSLLPTRVFDAVVWLAVGGLALVTEEGMRRIFLVPISLLQWLFVVRLGVAAGGSIAGEKEARAWAILLTTPLDNGEIIRDRAVDALHRSVPLLVPLLSLYWLAFARGLPWQQDLRDLVLHVGMPVVHLAGTIILLLGAGLSAGIHCKTTTGAIVMALGIYFGLAFVASPLFAGVPGVPVPARGAGRFDAVTSGISVAFVYAGLGSYLLLGAARELRRHVF